MPVSTDEVRRLAELSRLDLDPGEAESLAEQLGSILEPMAALARVDSGDAPVPVGVEAGSAPLRPDRAAFEPLRRSPEEFAPAFRDGFFLVPRLPALGGEAADPDSEAPG